MATACETPRTVADRPLGLRVRPDLKTAEVTYQGQPWRVVAEPLGRGYARLTPPEAIVLEAITPTATLQSLKQTWEARFAPRRITHRELLAYLAKLHERNLVLVDRPGQADVLIARRTKTVFKRTLGQFASLLSWRLPGIDPEPVLRWVTPLMAWLFTTPAVVAAILLGLAAGLHLIVHADELTRRLPTFQQFFGAHNWLPLAATLAVVKVLHEFGHAVCARVLGVRCWEMGAMFLVGTPVLYCDVSDAWLVPSKGKRMAISAAGILVELILASIATFVWWYAQPGLVQNLALTVMFVCSVGTLGFNGNPLLKFDGYYLLADLVEIPNLASRASEVWSRWLTVYGLGIESPDSIPLRTPWRVFCAGYGLAAAVYRVVILVSIFLFLRAVLAPYGADAVAYLLSGMGATGLIVRPLWRAGRFLFQPGRMAEIKRAHAIPLAVGVAAVTLAVLTVPLPDDAYGPLETQPAGGLSVHVVEAGTVQSLAVAEGQRVTAGEVLAVLRSVELELEIARLTSREIELADQIRSASVSRHADPVAARNLAALAQDHEAVTRQLAQLDVRRAALTLRAPRSGTVFAVPVVAVGSRRPIDELPGRSGTPFDAVNGSVRLESGEVFCLVGDATAREAHVVLDQADASRLRTGQTAEVLLFGHGGRTASSVVAAIAPAESETLSERLTTAGGGSVVARTEADGSVKAVVPVYLATVPLPESLGPVGIGIRGQARLRTGWTPLATRVWRSVMQTFHFAR